MKFKVGDILRRNEYVGRTETCEYDLRVNDIIKKHEVPFYTLTWADGTCPQFRMDYVVDYIDGAYFHIVKKVKATNLAKKIYPDAEEKEGYLEVTDVR